MSQQSPAAPGKGVVTYPTVEFAAGEVIFTQGDDGRCMFLIKKGQVEVLQSFGGQLRPTAMLDKGDFFGEMAILDEAPRRAEIRATTAVQLVQIDRDRFHHLLQRNPEIAVRMIRKLAGRLQKAEQRMVRVHTGQRATGSVNVQRLPVASVPTARLVHQIQGGADYPLPDKPICSIGRLDPTQGVLPDVDLTLADPKVSTSRRHARILRRGESFLIAEEQATNGTFVNGQRIPIDRAQRLSSGDEINFGAVRMRFLIDDE